MGFSDAIPIAVKQELETAGTYLNGQATEISGEIHQLAKYIENLKWAWQGAAHGYYEGLQTEWNLAADGLFGPDGVLGEIAHAMNVSWGNYSEAEENNSRTWQHR
jgi:uncharacterized protein YukE